MNAREKPVSFMSDGLTLRGMLGLSVGEANGEGIVLVHGWGGYRIGPHRMLVETARRLREAGYATLRFDVRGRGDSEGEADQTDLDSMIADTAAATEFLATKTGAKDLTLLGICSGSNVAIGAATLKPEVRTLVLWSTLPFQPEQKGSQRRRRAWHYLKQYARKALSPRTWKRLIRGEVNVGMVGKTIAGDGKPGAGERNLKDSARDIMAAFARYRGRALFVTGTMDPEGHEGREVFMPFCKAKGIDATFELVEGANHSYYNRTHAAEVVDTTLAWLTDRPETP